MPWRGTQKRRGITPFLGSEESEPCFRHPISGAQHWKDRSLSGFASRWDWQWGCQKPRPLLRNAHALLLPQQGSGSKLRGPEPLPGFLWRARCRPRPSWAPTMAPLALQSSFLLRPRPRQPRWVPRCREQSGLGPGKGRARAGITPAHAVAPLAPQHSFPREQRLLLLETALPWRTAPAWTQHCTRTGRAWPLPAPAAAVLPYGAEVPVLGGGRTHRGSRGSSDLTLGASDVATSWCSIPSLDRTLLAIGQRSPPSHLAPAPTLRHPCHLQPHLLAIVIAASLPRGEMWLELTSDTAHPPKPPGTCRLHKDAPRQGHPIQDQDR